MDTDFSPLETLQYALRRWWLVVVLVLVGAAVGWLAFRLRQPLFESHSAITFTIDYSRAGILTDEEVDRTLESAGDILASNRVLEQVVASAREQGVDIDVAHLQQIATRERSASAWIILVRHPDPVAAALLANLWAQHSMEFLAEATRYSLAAESLSRYQASLEDCLASSTSSLPAQPLCTRANLDSILAEIDVTGAELLRQKLASQGLIPGLGYSWTEKAQPAVSPERYGQGGLILAGMLVGLVIAVFAIQSRVWDRIVKTNHA